MSNRQSTSISAMQHAQTFTKPLDEESSYIGGRIGPKHAQVLATEVATTHVVTLITPGKALRV
ncbi:hypothetical protein GUITHDRAFT_151768, partial [Guillardia theta CCMP2712]